MASNTLPLHRATIYLPLHCRSCGPNLLQESHMNSISQSRRTFALRLSSLLAGLGLSRSVFASEAPQSNGGVQKLDYDGKPASGKQMITSLIVHNGLIYISGQGANDAGSVE